MLADVRRTRCPFSLYTSNTSRKFQIKVLRLPRRTIILSSIEYSLLLCGVDDSDVAEETSLCIRHVDGWTSYRPRGVNRMDCWRGRRGKFISRTISPFLARIRAESLRQSDLPSFHTFMTRYHDTSFTRLHDLHLDWDGEMTQDQAKDLEDLLKGGKAYLKRLLLPCLNQLDAQDGFTRAVASLEELQSLIATSDSSGALRSILSQLPSRLTELSLDLDRERWDGRESHKSHDDPALYISGFASTLKELTLLGTTLPHADTIYPELTELELTFGLAPKLSVLMTALPNLVTLRLNSETIPGNLIIDSDIECREENIAFQEHGHSWPSLKSFGGDPYSLYLLGLQQEVEVVSIPPGWAICGDDLHQLTSFLPPLRPKSLSLVLSDTEDILSLAFLNGCEKLVELDLGVEFSGEDALTVGESLVSNLTVDGHYLYLNRSCSAGKPSLRNASALPRTPGAFLDPWRLF